MFSSTAIPFQILPLILMFGEHFCITPTMIFPFLLTFLSSLSCTWQKGLQFHTKFLISFMLWSSISDFIDSMKFSIGTMPSSSEIAPQDDLLFEVT